MPRSSFVLDDPTPLTGPRIDIPARIGWLLRATRATTGLTLRETASALRDHDIALSTATVSRIENEGRRNNDALRGYARLVGLPDCYLRLAVDYLCDSFAYSPPAPEVPPVTLAHFDRVYEAVCAQHPTGDDWWAFSACQLPGAGFAMPSAAMEPLVARLAAELQRAATHARWTRYQTLAMLSVRGYAPVVRHAVEAALQDRHAQRFDDLVVSVSYHQSPASLALLAGLLSHESVGVARAGSHALQSMLVQGGASLEWWMATLPALVRGWEVAGDDHQRRELMTALTHALPPPMQEGLRAVARPVRLPEAAPEDWSRSSRNAHYRYSAEIARLLTAERGLPDDPMLARLLFESFFEPRGVRMSVATLLLAASPFRDRLAHVLPTVWDERPPGATRTSIARVAAFCFTDGQVPDLASLLGSEDAGELRHALSYYAVGSTPLPDAALERGLASDEMTMRHTVYALGMAGDARLAALARDEGRPERVRGAAQWWLDRGSRVRH